MVPLRSVVFLFLLLSFPWQGHLLHAQEAGDTCNTAGVLLESGLYTFDTTSASADNPCTPGRPTVWYKFVAPATGIVQADLCGSVFNTQLIVFQTTICPTSCLHFIGWNDDSCGEQSAVSFNVSLGGTYLIAIGGSGVTDVGWGVLNFDFAEDPGMRCEGALEITGPEQSLEVNTSGTVQGDPCTTSNRAFWFRYTAPANGQINTSFSSSLFRTRLTVYQTSGCPVTCDNKVSGADAPSGSSIAQVLTSVQGGATYYITASGTTPSDFGRGNFSFRYTADPGDSCENPIRINSPGTYPFDTTGRSADDPCYDTSPTVWFRYGPPSAGWVELTACGDDSFQPVLLAYDIEVSCPTSCDTLVGMASLPCDPAGALAIDVSHNSVYVFAVTGSNPGTAGSGFIDLKFHPYAGDTFGAPGVIYESGTYTFDTTGASADNHCRTPTPTVWYGFQFEQYGIVEADLCESSFDTTLHLYHELYGYFDCDLLIAFSDDECGTRSQLLFPVNPGTGYRLAIGGKNDDDFGPGILELTYTPLPEPPGGRCQNPIPLTATGTIPYDLTYAMLAGPYGPSRSVWYSFTAPASGLLSFNACSLHHQAYVSIFAASPSTCFGNTIIEGPDPCGVGRSLSFSATKNDTIVIAVTGMGIMDSGPGIMEFHFAPMPTHTCSTANPILGTGSYPLSTSGASMNDPCRPGVSPTVWYRYTAPHDARISADLCGASFDTYLTIFSGSSCPIACTSVVAQDDNSCGVASALEFDALGGETYYFCISGTNAAQAGLANLHVEVLSATTILGDINRDGQINVADVTQLGRLLDAGMPPPASIADLNHDGIVNWADLDAIVGLIINP